MDLTRFVDKKGEWLKATGPKSDIVISTRIRLARNLSNATFFGWAGPKTREKVLEDLIQGIKKLAHLKDANFVRIRDIDEIDREFLVERHLMSREHMVDADAKGLVFDEREMVSIMLNEEDHLRMQVIESGFNIMEAWRIIDDIDTNLGKNLEFAYSNKFGYLTSCPTNTGTGLRASVMLHLAALEMTEELEGVYDGITKLGFTMRGFYGEGSDASGDLFQISNQVSLGRSEMDIIDNLERVINKIIAREEATRSFLMTNKRQETEDGVHRSYGTLKSARIITSQEAIKLLSHVRLGVALGVITDINIGNVNEILLAMQPAHLQKNCGRILSQHERDIKRADLVRVKLGVGD